MHYFVPFVHVERCSDGALYPEKNISNIINYIYGLGTWHFLYYT